MTRHTTRDSYRVDFDAAALHRIGARQTLIRFGAGAAAAAAAALVSQLAGAGVSGPLLALPAILIASLTLIGEDDGTSRAIDDARGAALGGMGLVAFAIVASALLARTPTWLALVTATAAWAAVSLALYATQQVSRRPEDNRRT